MVNMDQLGSSAGIGTWGRPSGYTVAACSCTSGRCGFRASFSTSPGVRAHMFTFTTEPCRPRLTKTLQVLWCDSPLLVSPDVRTTNWTNVNLLFGLN